MANRIVVMNEGIVQQVGPPLELYDRPANVFVAGFIGSPTMNFVDATLAGENGTTAITSDGTHIPIAAGLGQNGLAVTLGLRPEHLQISDAGFPATIEVIEPLGMTTQLTVSALGTSLTVMVLERLPLAPGQRIRLSAAPLLVHVFDKASGQRLAGS